MSRGGGGSESSFWENEDVAVQINRPIRATSCPFDRLTVLWQLSIVSPCVLIKAQSPPGTQKYLQHARHDF